MSATITKKKNKKEEEERRRRSLHEASTPDVLSGGPTWSGLYGPVSWLIFFSLSPTVLLGISERIFSGCPYGDTTTRVSNPWLVAGNVVSSAARGGMR